MTSLSPSPITLQKCPVCNSQPTHTFDFTNDRWLISCPECGIGAAHMYDQQACEKWNKLGQITWVKHPPVQKGWYWYTVQDTSIVLPVYFDGKDYWGSNSPHDKLELIKTYEPLAKWWLGPIPCPEAPAPWR